MVLIIGFSGKIGVGKNYLAEVVLPRLLPHNCIPIHLAFADQIKIELYSRRQSDDINYTSLYVNKTDETRNALIEYGTEINRKKNKDIWVDALDMRIQTIISRGTRTDLIPIIIITDVRFKNEAEYIAEQGIIIRVEAPYRNEEKLLTEFHEDAEALEKVKCHSSETELDDYVFHHVIDNDFYAENVEQHLINIVNKYLPPKQSSDLNMIYVFLMMYVLCFILQYIFKFLEYYDFCLITLMFSIFALFLLTFESLVCKVA